MGIVVSSETRRDEKDRTNRQRPLVGCQRTDRLRVAEQEAEGLMQRHRRTPCFGKAKVKGLETVLQPVAKLR